MAKVLLDMKRRMADKMTYHNNVVNPIFIPQCLGIQDVGQAVNQGWRARKSIIIKISRKSYTPNDIVRLAEGGGTVRNTYLGHQPWTIPVSIACSG